MGARRQSLVNIPLTLRERYLQKEVVPFVGSGLSLAAGAPTWKGLLVGLLERFKKELVPVPYEGELRALIELGSTSDFPWIVEYLRSVRRGVIGNHIGEVCAHLQPQTGHRLIAKLQCPGIITTNFDDLIESAVFQEKGKVNVILPDNLQGLAQLKERSPWVLKLHGTFEESAHAVVSWADYERLAAAPSVAATLGWLLQRYTVLFLGFGLRDPDMLDQFSFLRFVFREYQQTHYALMEEGSIEGFRAKVLSDMYNIQIMRYSKSDDSHPEVTAFLNALLKCAPRESPLSLRILIFIISKNDSAEAGGTKILVKKPVYSTNSGQRRVSRIPYLLPSLTDTGYSEQQLVELGLRYLSRRFKSFKREHFKLQIDTDIFKSKKFSRSLGEEVPHEIRFVRVDLTPEAVELIGSEVPAAGHVFEWRSIKELRKHQPTMNVNGDVIREVSKRIGERQG